MAGLVLYGLTGASWLHPVAGFVITIFAVKEGIEAWHGELVEDESGNNRTQELDSSQEQR